jgi:hypothetical protein
VDLRGQLVVTMGHGALADHRPRDLAFVGERRQCAEVGEQNGALLDWSHRSAGPGRAGKWWADRLRLQLLAVAAAGPDEGGRMAITLLGEAQAQVEHVGLGGVSVGHAAELPGEVRLGPVEVAERQTHPGAHRFTISHNTASATTTRCSSLEPARIEQRDFTTYSWYPGGQACRQTD